MGIRSATSFLVFLLYIGYLSSPAFAQYQTEEAFPNLTFNAPVDVQHAGDGTNRLFVVEQGGVVKVFDNERLTAVADTFLNVSSDVATGGERGLLGLAFHPQFDQNGFFYVNKTEPSPLTTVVSRFTVDSTNSNAADPGSEVVLLTVRQPYSNHNGGQIQFGPDGMLYIALGDGGSQGDPDGNGQDTSTLLGSILRIDVDNPDSLLNYGIPPDNPFVGVAGSREEIFAYGLRNPWRFSFDSESGLLWAADVGQNEWEEVDIIELGKNYGWNTMEAFHCYEAASCDQTGLELPVWEYNHSGGNQSITGGYVYRGSRLPGLFGDYIFGDYVSGRIWALHQDSTYSATELVDATFNIPTFGVDESGELLIGAFDGKIYRLISEAPASVAASDSTFEDRVRLSWVAGAGAGATFKILRDSVLLSTEPNSASSYDDVSGEPGVTYEYCVIQDNGGGNESAPVCDDGIRVISPPSMVVASDTLYDDRVEVAWQDNSLIEAGYLVRRDSVTLATGGADIEVYQDSTALPGVAYQYCVAAVDGGGFESDEVCDTGIRAVVPPPASVAATDGLFSDIVRISWADQATNEAGYNVRREGTLIGSVPEDSTLFNDSTAVAGVSYEYCVSTVSQSGVESQQVCDSGRRGSSAPLLWAIDFSATMGALADTENQIGVADSATTGFDDDYDQPEAPPAPGDVIRVFFERPEWMHPLSDEFTVDIRRTVDLTDTMQVWDFEVLSTLSGDADLEFIFHGVDVPVILVEDTGARRTLTDGQTVSIALVADSPRTLTLAVGDTTAPMVAAGASMSGPRILRAEAVHNLDWSATDGFKIDSLFLSFSPDSAVTWSTVAALDDTMAFHWTVPDSELVTGAVLRIEATDLAGNRSSAQSSNFFAIAGDTIAVSIAPGWNLWGPILDSDQDSIGAALADDFQSFWSAFTYQNGGYIFARELSSTRGYWIGSIDPASIELHGSPILSDTAVGLATGWVLASNPFVVPFKIDSLHVSDGGAFVPFQNAVTAGWVNSAFRYNGSQYVVASEVNASEAIWLSTLQPGLTLRYPVHAYPLPELGKVASSEELLATRNEQDLWRISFEAEANGKRDVTATAGISLAGSNGFDPSLDVMEPPLPPGSSYVALYSDRPDLSGVLGGRLATDIRGVSGEAVSWTFKLESSEEEATLSWSHTPFPDSVTVTVEADGSVYDVRSISEITVPGNSTINLEARKTSVGVTEEIPTDNWLYQNYPNPFNPSTNIRFNVATAGRAQLDVFDVLGRRVHQLFNRDVSPGRYSVTWNAGSQASGLFIYRLEINDFVAIRTMLLIK